MFEHLHFTTGFKILLAKDESGDAENLNQSRQLIKLNNMKKLFFIAAVVVFAIGAATAQIYAPGGTEPIPCSENGLDCETVYGPVGYTVPFSTDPNAPQQGPATRMDITTIQLDCF